MKRSFLLVMFLAAFMAAALTGCAKVNVNELVQQGDDAYMNGNYVTADKTYTSVIELEKGTDEIYNNRGMCRMMQENYEDAIADFEQAITLNDSSAVYFNNCGLAYYKSENYEKASEMFGSAIELDNTVAAYYVNRGDCYYEMQNLELSTEDYQKALELDNSLSHAYNNLASTFFNVGDYQNAIDNYNNAIRLEPDNNVLYWNRGESYRMLEEYQSALDDFLTYQEMSTYVTIDFYLKKVEVEVELGMLKEARDDYTTSINILPSDADLYLGRANVSYAMENWNDALSDYGKYLNSTKSAVVYGNRGYCYYMLGQLDAALADLDLCISMDPDYAWAYYTRGQIKTDLEDYEAAKADFDKANELLGDQE